MGNAASVQYKPLPRRGDDCSVQYIPPLGCGRVCKMCSQQHVKCTILGGKLPCLRCEMNGQECVPNPIKRCGRRSLARMWKKPQPPVEISPLERKNNEGILRKNNGGKLPRPIKIDGKIFDPVRLLAEVKSRGGYEHMSKTEGAFTDLMKDLLFAQGKSDVKATNAVYRLKRYVKKYLLPHEEQSRTTVPVQNRKRSYLELQIRTRKFLDKLKGDEHRGQRKRLELKILEFNMKIAERERHNGV